MSNIIGDLLWNYFTKPYQAYVLDLAVQNAVDMKMSGQEIAADYAQTQLDAYNITDAAMRSNFTKRIAGLPPAKADPTNAGKSLLDTVSGQGAKAQLEAIAGVQIGPEDIFTKRLFDQLGLVTNVGALAAAAEIAGAAIPTTNLQYAGKAVTEYMDLAGITQITGFGYGMMFSNVVTPLISYELNRKIRAGLPMAGDAVQMGCRHLLTDTDVNDILAKQGFSDQYITAMKKNYLFYPGAQDLVRFAVRDTFNPAVVQKYGYDTDYPSAIDPYAVESGMSPEWMKHFWRAHWQLPSVTLGYEMLHRNAITIEELADLLRINDMAPWWIPKVIAMSYSPYTRVDTRRLYADGVITRDEVKRNYLDIGYDEDHAEKLTEWTVKGKTASGGAKARDLSESALIKSYKFGSISKDELTKSLMGLGYDTTETGLIISNTDYDLLQDELSYEYAALKAEYLAGMKSESDLTAALGGLKLNQNEQKRWMNGFKAAKRIQDAKEFAAAAKLAAE